MTERIKKLILKVKKPNCFFETNTDIVSLCFFKIRNAMKIRFTLVFLLISLTLCAQRSIFEDQQTIQKIEKELDSIYNFNFDNSEAIYDELKQKYPNHPLPPLFNAVRIYWQYFPVTPADSLSNLYVKYNTDAIHKAEALLEMDKNDPEASFFNLMARLLVMQYYADNHQSSKVAPHIRTAYKMAKKGFELDNQIQDFLFSTGLYNYYREAYPEKHPVYKPFAYFFPDGDKKLGIKQLEKNWHNGIFLDAESLSFLVYITLNFEGNFSKSSRYTRELHKAYPNNPLYLSYRIRTLLLLHKYKKALPMIDQLEKNHSSNQFFNVMVYIYKGVYAEKKDHDFYTAEQLYMKAIALSEKYKPFINNRISYAYFGLARIWKNKNNQKSIEYRNKAESLSSYPHMNFD